MADEMDRTNPDRLPRRARKAEPVLLPEPTPDPRPVPPELPPVVDPPSDPPVVDPPSDPPVVDPPVVDPPVVDPPSDPPVVVPTKPEDLFRAYLEDRDNAALRAAVVKTLDRLGTFVVYDRAGSGFVLSTREFVLRGEHHPAPPAGRVAVVPV